MNENPESKQLATRFNEAVTNPLLIATRTIIRVFIVALVMWYGSKAVLWMLDKLTGVILLVVLSIFFAYLIAPLVDLVRRPFGFRGHQHVMPRGIAIGIVYLVLFGSIVLSVYIATPILSQQFTQLSQQTPNYTKAVKYRAERFRDAYEDRLPESVRNVINERVLSQLEPLGESVLTGFLNVLLTLTIYLPWLVLIPVFGFFILKDVEMFRLTALRMFPSGRWRWRADDFFQDVNKTLAAYTRAQLIACLLIGTICGIGFWLIGLPYALLLAVMAGVFEFVPLVGPLLVVLIATPIAGYYSFNQGVATLIFLLVLRIVHDYVTYPRIIGHGIHLHPLAVILAILGGAELGGIAGIFLAIPVVALATVTHQNWVEHRGTGLVAELLTPEDDGSAPAPLPEPPPKLDPPAVGQEWTNAPSEPTDEYPNASTTAEDMARLRPDLTTGELKLPHEE